MPSEIPSLYIILIYKTHSHPTSIAVTILGVLVGRVLLLFRTLQLGSAPRQLQAVPELDTFHI